MNDSLNIDHLFANAKSNIKDNLEDSVIQKAALMFDFDIKKDFENINKKQIEILQTDALANSKGRFFLPNHIRNLVLNQMVQNNQIESFIEDQKLTEDYTKILLKVLKNEVLDIESLNSKDLFYLHKLSMVLPERITELQVRNIKFELERRQFLKHFNLLTQNFAGRKIEYSKLKAYVDWLPPDNLLKNIESRFRNLINWHTKNPMLITGIGGIGKSTLVSKFILDHVSVTKGQQKLPFVYIDFDMIGFSISEPMNIFIEALRQLSLQFPLNREIFQKVISYISDEITSKVSNITNSTSDGSRALILDSIEKSLSQYHTELSSFNSPVLVVFDSFEELQYRANTTELRNFFNTIKQVAERLPRIRPVFIGRAIIDEEIVNTQFEIVPLTNFDSESADAILEIYGIETKTVRKSIFNKFGGNPLTLQLAASIFLKQNSESLNIKTRNLISRVEENKIQEQLVRRLLDNIHDPSAKAISLPGMMVRKINPKVIKHILAGPCGLSNIIDLEATRIYYCLEKEAFLLSKSHLHKEFEFRQDLRLACEAMILVQYASQVAEIHAKAIDYYHESSKVEDQAEYYFHWLKSGRNPEILTKEIYDEVRSYLENSIHELPPKSQLHIDKLIGSGASQKSINESELYQWEEYFSRIILEAFRGEIDQLEQLKNQLSTRKERTYRTNLPIVEAILYQRLGNLKTSNEVIDATLKNTFKIKEDQLPFNRSELMFIKVQNLEYQDEYEDALDILLTLETEANLSSNDGLKQKIRFIKERLLSRLSDDDELALSPFYATTAEFNQIMDITWALFFSVKLLNKKWSFKNASEFKTTYDLISKDVNSNRALEALSFEKTGFYWSDIALPASLEISIRDLLYILEIVPEQKVSMME